MHGIVGVNGLIRPLTTGRQTWAEPNNPDLWIDLSYARGNTGALRIVHLCFNADCVNIRKTLVHLHAFLAGVRRYHVVLGRFQQQLARGKPVCSL